MDICAAERIAEEAGPVVGEGGYGIVARELAGDFSHAGRFRVDAEASAVVVEYGAEAERACPAEDNAFADE